VRVRQRADKYAQISGLQVKIRDYFGAEKRCA
jgi:hypothetical protein